ncbi:hypothetical protein Tco_1406967 [Tanacetum coccineum]
MVAYLIKSEGSEGFHEIIDFLSGSHINYALTENPTIYVSLIEQFWQTAALSTAEDGVQAITATIDGREKTITEASLRRHLKLEDFEGLTSLPNKEIFEQLLTGRYAITSDSLTFLKGHFSPQWKFFIHTILHCLSSKKTAWDQFSSNLATAIICLATNRTCNFSRYIFDVMVKNLDSTHKFLMYPSTPTTPPSTQHPHEAEEPTTMPHDSPLEVMRTKKTYSTALTKLVLRVKKLENQLKSGKARRRARIVLSEDEDAAEDPSKQGRKIPQIDTDPNISLVQDEGTSLFQQDKEVHEKTSADTEEISTANLPISTASPPKAPTTEVSTAAAALVYIRRSALKAKDKGKAIMTEPEPPKKLKKRVQVQLSVDEELARKIQEEDQARAIAEQEQERINLEAALELQRQLNERQEVPAEPTQTQNIDWNDPSILRPIFERVWDQNQIFVPMDFEIEKESSKRVEEEKVQEEDVKPEQIMKVSSEKSGGRRRKSLARKRPRETQDEETYKKQKHEDDAEKKELRLSLKLVSDEDKDIDYEVLDMNYPIVDWESQILGSDGEREMQVYKITRADGISKFYSNLSRMLETFDRDDVLKLHILVMERFPNNDPVGYDLLLWGDLKVLVDPKEDDDIWKNQQDWKMIS